MFQPVSTYMFRPFKRTIGVAVERDKAQAEATTLRLGTAEAEAEKRRCAAIAHFPRGCILPDVGCI